MLTKLEIVPLPLLKKTGETLFQCFDVHYELTDNNQDCNAVLKVQRRNDKWEFDLGKSESLKVKREIYLPGVEAPAQTEFILSNDENILSQLIVVKPVRRWEIFLVLHSHTDLGFTAPISDVAKIHNDNTDVAVLYCNETQNWPEGSRFKWTCEVSWQLQNYIRERSQDKVNALFNQVRKNNIEVAGLYSGELTELLGHEEAARSFYYAAKLRKKYDINIDTAMLCDVPGCTKGLVQVMAKSGIKNLIIADNNFIAPFLKRTDLPRPFYWLGDDNTKILSWYTDHPFYAYIEGQNYGLSYSYTETRDKLPHKLLELENSGYGFKEFQLQYAFDNFRIEFRPAAIVKEWNETWEYPKIKISTAGNFLNTMRSRYDPQLPERKGDWTNWWDGIVSGFPNETSLARKMHVKVPAIETLAACLNVQTGMQYPGDKLNQMYDDLLAFDEHSGTGMVWEAKSEEQQQMALREGYGFIQKPLEELLNMYGKIEQELSNNVEVDSDSVLVFNPSSINNSGWTEVKLEKADGLYNLIDKTNCKNIQGIVTHNILKFYAEDIPSVGYKIYQLIKEEAGNILMDPDIKLTGIKGTLVIENVHWKLEVDKSNGKIISLFSKTLKKEIVSTEFNSPVAYQPKPVVQVEMGKYVPEIYNGDEVPGEIIEFKSTEVKVNMSVNGGFAECLVDHFYKSHSWLSQKIMLENELVRFENKLESNFIYDKELLKEFISAHGMLYFLYAFNIPHAKFRYEAPCTVINPKEEQFKGSCMDYYAVQRWCQLYNNNLVLNFSSFDSPLIDVGAIALHKYRENFAGDPSKFFVRAVSLADLNNGLGSPYNQKPDLYFQFALSVNKAEDRFIADEQLPSVIPAHILGNRLHNSLSAFYLKPKGSTKIRDNFIRILSPNYELMTIKKAEDNDDLIIRIREIAGIKSSAVVEINLFSIRKVFRTMITEEIIDELLFSGNIVNINAEPYSVETIRVVEVNEFN